MSAQSCLAGPALDVGLVTNALEAQLGFYCGILGLPKSGEVSIPGVGTIHRLAAGASVLRLMVPEQAAQEVDNSGFFSGSTGIRYIAIKVTGLADVIAQIEEKGFRTIVPTRELRPGVQVAIVGDADGNAVELMEEQAT
ncbi:VOC family protein [Erythrobacter aurantius]|uniref:VOC family protein n=1 Tax=Erythrobacter aurantius TaxID=2909249 RepID=UPI002079ED89|nr:VOC family protein [Erythrobacter aurantius]